MLMNVQITAEKKPKKRTADALWKVNSNQKFFSFEHFTWSKELSDQWIF